MSVFSPVLAAAFGAGAQPLPWERGDAGIGDFLDLFGGGTFTRSTEGSYLTGAPTDGSAAFLAWAGVNARRIENRGDGLGAMLLMEGSRTNLVLRSRAIDDAAWTAGSAVVTTADQNGGPDAAGLADRSNVSSAGISRYQPALSGVGTFAGSLWVRGTSGAVSHQMAVFDATFNPAILAATTTWGRNSRVATTATALGLLPVEARDRTAQGGQVATAQDVITDLHQLEAGFFPSSAIRTLGTTVTRGADVLSYAVGQYPASFLTRGFRVTVALDCTSAELVSAAADMRLVQVGATDFLRIRQSGANCVVDLVCGGVVKGTLTVTITSRAQLLTISAQPLLGTLTVSGATTGNGTNTVAGAAWGSGTLYVGADNAAANPAFGRFGSVVAL